MLRAKVLGSLVSTVKYEELKGIKLLVVQTYNGEQKADVIIAADAIGVFGEGDDVYLIEGREAGLPFKKMIPVDASIVGNIDEYKINIK